MIIIFTWQERKQILKGLSGFDLVMVRFEPLAGGIVITTPHCLSPEQSWRLKYAAEVSFIDVAETWFSEHY